MIERIVAIVGRPNVGKSALFNRLAGQRIAIVHDQPGVTRDRITTECTLGREPFTIIDTGGIGGNVDLDFTKQVHAEVDLALEAAHVIVFVVDAQDGITPVDEDLARKLRRGKKPLILAINKIDHDKHSSNTADFQRFGFPVQVPISAEHNRGIGWLVETIESRLPAAEERPEVNEDEEGGEPVEKEFVARPVRIAIVGRPNVGKSSLTNAILDDARTLVSPIAGTTRDAVDIPYQHGNKHYVLIDTAGIRHRSKVSASVEVFSVMRAETSIKRADICCLVIDAAAGITAMDKKIAGKIQDARKPCVVAVNKWDLVKDRTSTKKELNAFIEELESNLFAINYAPLVMCSAKTGSEMTRLFKMIEKIRNSAKARIGTGVLNRLLQTAASAAPPALRSGKRFKILYATQPNPAPHLAIPQPEIVFFCNRAENLDESYRRYLEGCIRKEVPYPGLPLIFHFRERETRGERRK
jgi:GTP-binding protein